jgi:formylglycine-generating enzyme required for sulfatase activity
MGIKKMAKGDLIRNAVEAMIVIGKDVVPAGNMLFEVGKWLFDKYKEHKVNKRLEDLEEGAKIKPQEAVQIAREEIQRQRQNGKTISGDFERQLVERAAMMPAMVNQHIQATLQQAQRYGTQATLALPIGDQIEDYQRTAFYQSLIPPRAQRFHKGDPVPHDNPQWKLVEMLGSGGFGEVWQADHQTSKKSKAVKFCLDEQSAKLLKHEAKALIDLSQKLPDHPNIVDLKDIQLEQEPYWLAFEKVEGGTLQSLMQAKQLTVQESLELFIPIVEAMALVHQAGIIHRDLKPVNILLTSKNVPKIADFGIGKIMAEQTASTQQTKSLFTAMGYGTPDYMSPEQKMLLPAHFSDDVYSLGVIFWQMLSHTLQAPNYLRDSLENLNISEHLKNLLIQCIEKPRTKRIQNAGELLQRLKTGNPPTKKSSVFVYIAISVVVAVVGFLFINKEKPKDIPPPPPPVVEKVAPPVAPPKVEEKVVKQPDPPKVEKVVEKPVVKPTPQVGETFKDCSDCPDMVVLVGGTFKMGDNSSKYDDEKPIHEVEIKPFAIGKFEVTLGEFKAFVNATNYSVKTVSWCNWDSGKFAENDRQPVQCVSWEDATKYAEWLSKKTAKKYRLPTEAEWEYAARANTSTKWSFGDNESDLKEYAWYDKNSGNGTHEVGQKKPNGFGLFDMHGNVWEWTCSDKENYSKNKHLECSSNNNANKSLRGGSWYYVAGGCRSALRYDGSPASRLDSVGFRVVSVFSLQDYCIPLIFNTFCNTDEH